MTTQPLPTTHPRTFRSKLLWLATAATGAILWVYRRLAPQREPQPLTRTEKKQRRKALARAASTPARRKRAA